MPTITGFEPAREQTKVPLPRDLLDAIKPIALANQRSMVGEIRFALEEHIRRSQKET